ncbi:hypothetical protein G7Y31_06765 [Corynebacterium lizhenjunii]|uniref:Uncharacterized protein n=1 Tax=Corynebacterium lizhenjunii TaxID=2709394 RepID=A0A7T0P9T6_9CORY|nr:hypothetical protein [Corynebacterium lizhenjunii]QPK78286.1 hypothetical protein G7Y31_06765 [Corynebacterium lizhenjunii]
MNHNEPWMRPPLTPAQQEQLDYYATRALAIFEAVGVIPEYLAQMLEHRSYDQIELAMAIQMEVFWDYMFDYSSPHITRDGTPCIAESIQINSLEDDAKIIINIDNQPISKVVKRIQDMPRIMEEIENGNQ